MSRAHRIGVMGVGSVVAMLLGLSAPALAAPPPNDNRAQAQVIRLGDTVSGTTVDATVEPVEPASGCASSGPSVWYRVDFSSDGRAIALLQAHGDLDVVVDIFRRERSQTQFAACDVSDRHGQASSDFRVKAGESFLIRVAQRPESVPGKFDLTVDLAKPEQGPPGRKLPSGGAKGNVRRVFEPSNAWSSRLHAGRTYRVNLSSERCMGLAIYAPGTSSFDEEPVRTVGCSGYAVFTPAAGEGGRYSFVVRPGTSRDVQDYHLQVGQVGTDDRSPGRFIRNHAVARGDLNARRLDVVDLYRFDVVTRSITELRLDSGADFTVTLRTEWGHRIDSGTDLSVLTRPGRYFAEVRAARQEKGHYRLTRASRVITRTRIFASPTVAPPGGGVSLITRISPGVSGPVTITVERFDPLAGFQFMRQITTRAFAGTAIVRLVPPAIGHYRARVTFAGTRDAATSRSGWKQFTVQTPLTE